MIKTRKEHYKGNGECHQNHLSEGLPTTSQNKNSVLWDKNEKNAEQMGKLREAPCFFVPFIRLLNLRLFMNASCEPLMVSVYVC